MRQFRGGSKVYQGPHIKTLRCSPLHSAFNLFLLLFFLSNISSYHPPLTCPPASNYLRTCCTTRLRHYWLLFNNYHPWLPPMYCTLCMYVFIFVTVAVAIAVAFLNVSNVYLNVIIIAIQHGGGFAALYNWFDFSFCIHVGADFSQSSNGSHLSSRFHLEITSHRWVEWIKR